MRESMGEFGYFSWLQSFSTVATLPGRGSTQFDYWPKDPDDSWSAAELVSLFRQPVS